MHEITAKTHTRAPTLKFFLILSVASLVLNLGGREASAAAVQWTADKNPNGIISVFNASTNKDTYAPGEMITVTASANSTDSNFGPNTRGLNAISDFFGGEHGGTNRQGVGIALDSLVGRKLCGYEGFTTSCTVSASFSAPTSAGTYSVASIWGCGGECVQSSLRISVVPPQPSLVINFSASSSVNPSNSSASYITIPYGTAVDLRYGSAGATSCLLTGLPSSRTVVNNGSGVVNSGPLTGTKNYYYVCEGSSSAGSPVAGYKKIVVYVTPPAAVCGSADGAYSAVAPSGNLCASGAATQVTAFPVCNASFHGYPTGCSRGTGPFWYCPYEAFDGEEYYTANDVCTSDTSIAGWNWYCSGGSNASCSAPSSLSSISPGLTVPTAALSASPVSVPYNSPTTLTWSSTNATTCTAGGPWSNASAPLAGSIATAPLLAATTFTLQCTGPGGTTPVQSVTVPLSAPACANGANNPLRCTICPSNLAYVGGACVGCTGGCTGGPTSVTTPIANLICNNGKTNPPGCDASAATVTLSANPSTVDTGSPAKLFWISSPGTVSCTSLNTGSGEGAFSTDGSANNFFGATTQPLTSSKNYQIYCDGPGGRVFSNTVPVTVLQPTLTISANPLRVSIGGSSKLTWNATDVTSCTVHGDNGFVSNKSSGQSVDTGSINTQTTFTLTCQVIGTSISNSVTVNVSPIFQPF